MILERDPVCEHKLRLQRIAIVRLVESIYANLHPFGYYAIHKLTLYVKIKKKTDVSKSSLILRAEQIVAHMKIAVAKGDGIGPEIMDAVLKIFNANKVPLEFEFVEMGKWVFDKGFSNGMTDNAKTTIEDLGILFKGPMETPKGKGVKSVNVTARKTW